MRIKNQNKPRIRFNRFTDAWEQRKLGETTQITMGQSPSSENYTDNSNDHILVQGNADMKNGRVLPRVWTTQVTKQAEKDDLILSVRAPVGDVGKTDYDVVIGRGVAGIKGNEFIFQLLTRMKVNGYWEKLSTGSTFDSINSNDIKEATVLIPNIDEQEVIGTFFSNLDKLITLHQRKLDKTKELKKTMLSKMFPKNGEDKPEFRFSGFTDAWEQEQLGRVLIEFSEKSKIENEYRVLSSTNIGMELREGRVSGQSNIGYKIVDNGDLILSPQNLWLGNININNIGKGLVSPSYKTFKFKEIDSNFIKPQLRTPKMMESYKNSSTQGASVVRRNLDSELFEQIIILIPTQSEQRQIGNFFQNLDNLITLHQRKVDNLELMKKYFLKNMFV